MEDHVPRHAQMGAWVLINDRWYQDGHVTPFVEFNPMTACTRNWDLRKHGDEKDGRKDQCNNRVQEFMKLVYKVVQHKSGKDRESIRWPRVGIVPTCRVIGIKAVAEED